MMPNLLLRLERFRTRTWGEKRDILASYALRLWKNTTAPIPIIRRMEPGFYFLVWNDVIREGILTDTFEHRERKFVQAFLRPGMTALDVGAYLGIYTLTASVLVGNSGRVIAFEPAPLQQRRLRWHLLINRCKNVRIEKLALGSKEGEADLFVPGAGAEGFSSLRSPNVGAPIRRLSIRVAPLDVYATRHSLKRIDFVKVDVEGGELDFFRGGVDILSREPRPAILCELQDSRTATWGHVAADAAAFLQELGYRWFGVTEKGLLRPMPEKPERYEGNFVAVPLERMHQIQEITANGSR